MQIEVKLYANFQEFLPPGSGKYSCLVHLDDQATLGQVLKTLKIPDSLPLIALVNGLHGQMDDPLKPGDVVSIFPPVAGG